MQFRKLANFVLDYCFIDKWQLNGSFVLDFHGEEIIRKFPLSQKPLFDQVEAWLLLLKISHFINIVYLINLAICDTQQFFVLKRMKNSIARVDIISTCTLWIYYLNWPCLFPSFSKSAITLFLLFVEQAPKK